MSLLAFISFTFLPFIFVVVFAFLIIYRRDFLIHTLIFTSIFSFFAIFISSILQLSISLLFSHFLKQKGTLSLIFNSFIYSGAIEEITKSLFFYYILVFFEPANIEKTKPIIQSYSKETRQQLLILAMFFASCFAGFENISYMVFNIKLLPIRLITASLFHILVAPYYLKAISRQNSIRLIFIIIPILLHGIYNMLAMIGGAFLPLSFVIIFFLGVRMLIN